MRFGCARRTLWHSLRVDQHALTHEETEALAYFTTEEERYFYALSILLDDGLCWAISRDDDWAWMTIAGQSVFPIWPHAEHAAAYVEGDMEIFPITLSDFEQHWLPRLESTGEGVLVFAVPEEAAVIASAEGITVDLAAERELRANPEAVKPYQDLLVESVNAALDAGGDLDVDELLAAAERESRGDERPAVDPGGILRPSPRALTSGNRQEAGEAPAPPRAPTGPGAPLGPGPTPAVQPPAADDDLAGRRRRRQAAAEAAEDSDGTGPPPLF